MIFIMGIIAGLAVGGPAGAGYIIVRSRWRLARSAAASAREHIGSVARVLGIATALAGVAVLAGVGAALGWWSS